MNDVTINGASAETQAQALRGAIEAQIPAPGAICVTAAETGDATEAVALSIAHAFAESGHTTLFLDASGSGLDAGDDELAGLPELQTAEAIADPHRAAATLGDLFVARLAARACGRLRSEEVKEAIAKLRGLYDFVVVNAGESVRGGGPLFFARDVDAVVVSIRLGRAPTRNDTILIERLATVGANVLGIVPVTGLVKRRVRRTAVAGDHVAAPVLQTKARVAH
jgi:Mrp family chromosome partitioning ATPase